MKVTTVYVNPPIPSRDYDWMAHFADLGEDGPTGRGSNEEAAVLDLCEQTADLWMDALPTFAFKAGRACAQKGESRLCNPYTEAQAFPDGTKCGEWFAGFDSVTA